MTLLMESPSPMIRKTTALGDAARRLRSQARWNVMLVLLDLLRAGRPSSARPATGSSLGGPGACPAEHVHAPHCGMCLTPPAGQARRPGAGLLRGDPTSSRPRCRTPATG